MTYEDETEIFLLMSQNLKQPRGIMDYGTNKQMTLSFTSEKKAQDFIKKARTRGLFKDIDLFYRMTVGEFFEWKEKKMIQSELLIDPKPEMFDHSVFQDVVDKHN